MINNSICYLKNIWIEEISIKSIIISSFKMLISTMKMVKSFQKLMLIVLSILKVNLRSTKPPSETKCLKILKIFLVELEEKSKNKESELLSLWKTLINLDMVTLLKTNLDYPWPWLKSHSLKPNSHWFLTIMHVKINKDMFNGKNSLKILIKYSDLKNYKKHYQMKN